MTDTRSTLPFALTAFGIPHVMGYLKTSDGADNEYPLTATGLMDTAVEMGVAAIEIPVDGTNTDAIGRLMEDLAARNLTVIPDYTTLLDADTERFKVFLRAANRLGSPVARVTISRVLCGDRRDFEGGWDAHLERAAERLREVLPLAEDLGVVVCLENHQDATSEDLIRLHEASGLSTAFGVTLDAGNPMAVGEGPLEFAHRIGALVRHIHVKDYTIHFAPNGYRLVRCAAGEGLVPFPELLSLVRSHGNTILPGIEIAAQATRTIPILEPSWWSHYPVSQATYLPEALRILWRHGRSADEAYSSAWERGESSAAVIEEEWDVLRRSVDYFRAITN